MRWHWQVPERERLVGAGRLCRPDTDQLGVRHSALPAPVADHPYTNTGRGSADPAPRPDTPPALRAPGNHAAAWGWVRPGWDRRANPEYRCTPGGTRRHSGPADAAADRPRAAE